MKNFEYLEKYFPKYYSNSSIKTLNDMAAFIDGDIDRTELICRQSWLRGWFPERIKREFESRMDKAIEYAMGNQIYIAYNDFYNKTKEDPLYAVCIIQYPDDQEPTEVTIKLSSDIIEHEDDSIFYYCTSINGFLPLVNEGIEEFKIIKFLNFN